MCHHCQGFWPQPLMIPEQQLLTNHIGWHHTWAITCMPQDTILACDTCFKKQDCNRLSTRPISTILDHGEKQGEWVRLLQSLQVESASSQWYWKFNAMMLRIFYVTLLRQNNHLISSIKILHWSYVLIIHGDIILKYSNTRIKGGNHAVHHVMRGLHFPNIFNGLNQLKWLAMFNFRCFQGYTTAGSNYWVSNEGTSCLNCLVHWEAVEADLIKIWRSHPYDREKRYC